MTSDAVPAVAVILTVVEAVAVGVPLIVLPLSVNPAGSVPSVTANVTAEPSEATASSVCVKTVSNAPLTV